MDDLYCQDHPANVTTLNWPLWMICTAKTVQLMWQNS